MSLQGCSRTILRNRSVQIGLGIYVLSLTLRLIVLMELKDLPTFAECTVLDMRGNHEFALAILQGLRPTTYYKAPFYSYFLAAVYLIAGPDPFNARLVQVALTSLTPVLTFLIGQRLFGRPVGLIAGLVSSFFWTFLYLSVELLDAGLGCLFYMLLAYLLIALDDRRRVTWFVCGLVLGLGAITRPNILAFAPVLAITVLIVTWRRARRSSAGGAEFVSPTAEAVWYPPIQNPKSKIPNHLAPIPEPPPSAGRSALVNVVLLTLGCCLPIAPVTLRNRLVGGEWVLLGAYGGMNLYVANNPYSDSKNGPLLVDDSTFVEPTSYDPNEPWANCCLNYYSAYRTAETKLGRPPKPGEFSQVMSEMAWDFIRRNPGWFARHAFRRLCWLFNTFEFPSNRNLYDFRQYSRVLTAASVLQFGVICPLGLLGLGLALCKPEHRRARMAYYLGMIASLAFPAALYHVNHRFRVPIVHLLMPFAGFGLLEVIQLFRPDVAWGRRVVLSGILLVLGLFSNLNLFNYWDTRGAHLQWAMVSACEKAGRTDMLPKAVQDLEEALAKFGDLTRPSDTSLLLKHAGPMRWLFLYYYRQGNIPKALTYATIMLEKESFDPVGAREAFKLFDRLGDRKGAEQVLRRMEGHVGPAVMGEHLVAFAKRFGDPEALLRAKEYYEIAIHLSPTDLDHHRRLTEVRELIQNTTTGAASRPTSTTRSARPS